MRVVLDTNVLISIVLGSGAPNRIFTTWRAESFDLVISPELLAELREVIVRPHITNYARFSSSRAGELVAAIQNAAHWVYPQRQITRVTADPDDDRVLEAAVEGEADYIVTGDRHLLDLKRHESTEIVTPAEFLAILAEARNP